MNLVFFYLLCFVICSITSIFNSGVSGKRICESLQLDDDEIEDGSDTSRFICEKKFEPLKQNVDKFKEGNSIGESSAFEDDWPDYYGEDIAQDQEDSDNDEDVDENKFYEQSNPRSQQPQKSRLERTTAGSGTSPTNDNVAEDSSFRVDAEDYPDHSSGGDDSYVQESSTVESDCYPWDTGENHSSGRRRCARTRRGRARGAQTQTQTGSQADLELLFVPPKLIFFDNPISIPKMLEFSVQNPSAHADIHIFSVTCGDVQFHPVMFHPQVIPPNGATSLQLLFLPYHIETSVSELLLATSAGQFYYPVEGHAVINPYRLYPLIGYRFPSGASKIDVPIVIYNPHNEVLHIREVFTTKDFLALKGIPANSDDIYSSNNNRSAIAGGTSQPVLPPSTALLDSTSSLTQSSLPPSSSGAAGSSSGSSATLRIADADSARGSSTDSCSSSSSNSRGNARARAKADDMAWLVQPGLEKEIITLSISKAMAPGDYKGYLHVKTDRDNIVLPVELQVLEGGVHCTHDLIDFGLLTAVAEQKTMQLRLLNSGLSNLQVLQILPADPDPHLQIQLMPNPIVYSATGDNPDPCLVATLTYTASNPGKVVNKLLVWTNSSNAALAEVEVPYTVTILHGGVGFDHQRAVFVVPSRNVSYLSMIRRSNKVRFRISRCDECAADAACAGDDCGGAGAVEQTGRFRTGSHCRRDLALQKAQLPVVIVEREFLLTNYFSIPVTLQAISVGSCSEVLSVDNYNSSGSGSGSSSVLLDRDGNGNSVSSLSKWPPIMIYFNLTRAQQLAESEEKYLPKTCWAEILTNVSSHRVPLHIVDGALLLSFMDALLIEDALDVHRYQSMKFPCDAPYFAEERRGSSASSSPPSASLSSAKDPAPHLLPQRGVATEPTDAANGTMNRTGTSIVQQQMVGKRFSCSSSLLNSDEYHVDLGNLSVHEPRNLRIAFSNENPIRIGLEVASASHDLCFCFESSWPISFKEDDAAALHISSLKGRTFQEALAEPARCSCAGRDGPLTAATPPESVAHHGNRSGPSPFDSKKAKSSYHSLFSVVIAESFSTSYSKSSESEGEERAAVLPCGRQRAVLSLTTAFQQMKLFVYFTAVDAKLSTAVAADDDSEGGVFILGMERHLKLSTSSSFDESIKEPQFAVKGDDFSLYFAASLNNKPFIKIRPRSTVTYAIQPTNMCNDNGKAGLSNLWNCSYSILRNARLLDTVGSVQAGAAIADEFKYLEPAMMDVKTPAAAYKIRQRLKRKWLAQFPSGLPLPPVDVIVQAPQTRHVHRVENTTMQSPLAVMADLYSLRLPVCSTGDVNWFYINVFNPFKFPLSFSLRQSRSGSSGGGVVQPQRSVNFSAMELSNSDLAARPETISAQGWFNCDIPDAFREDSEDSSSFAAAATDSSSPPSNTEGRILSAESPADASSFFAGSSHNADHHHTFSSPLSSLPSESTPSSHTAVHSAEELSQMCSGGDATGLQNLVSLVRGVTLHRRPRSKETSQRTASRISDEESSSGDASSPFIMHSLSSAEWVALPYSTARIGPIMVSSKDSRSQGNAAVFYVFNNFTGFDKVEVQGSFGVAQLAVSKVSREAASRGDKRKFFNLSSESPRSNLFLVKDVVVSSLSDRFRVTVRNNGAVSATIHDVVVGGRSCGAIKSWLRWRRDNAGDGMRVLCERFPLQVPPNEEVSLVLTPPTSCAYLSKSESIVLILDDHSGAFSSIKVLLDFYSADSIQQECLHAFTSGYLRWLCLVVAAASFAGLCLLGGRGAVKVCAMWMMQRKRNPDLLRQYRKRKGARPQLNSIHPATSSISLLKPINLSSLPVLPAVPHSSAATADLSDVAPHSSDPRSLQSLSLAALRVSLSVKEGDTPPQLPIRMKAVELLISKRRVASTSKSDDTVTVTVRKNSTPLSVSPSTARALPPPPKNTATATALPATKLTLLPKESPSVAHSEPSEFEGDKQLTSTESSRHHSTTSSFSLTQTDGASPKSQRPALFLHLEDNFAELAGSGQSAHPLPASFAHYNESPDASSLTGTSSSTDELLSFQNQSHPKQLLASPSPSPAWEPATEKGKAQGDAKDNEKASFTTVPAKKKPQKEKTKQPKASTAEPTAPVAVAVSAAVQREAASTPPQQDSGEKVAVAGKSVRPGKGIQAAVANTTSSTTNHSNEKAPPAPAPTGKLAPPIIVKRPAPVVPLPIPPPARVTIVRPVVPTAAQTPSLSVAPKQEVSPGKTFLTIVADARDALSQEQQRQDQSGAISTAEPPSASPSHASKSTAVDGEDRSPPQQQDLQPIREADAFADEEEVPAVVVADPANIEAPSFDEPEPEPEPEQDLSMSLWADDLDLDEVTEFLRVEQERELLEGKQRADFGGSTSAEPAFMTGLESGFLGLGLDLGLGVGSNSQSFALDYRRQLMLSQFLGEEENTISLDSPLFSYHNELLLDTEDDAAEISADRNSLTQKQDLPSGRSSFTGDSLVLPTEIGDDLTFNLMKATELNPECTPYIPWASRQGQGALPLHSLSGPLPDLSTASLDLGLGSYSSQQAAQPYRGGARLSGGELDGIMGLEPISSNTHRGAGSAPLMSASVDAAMPYSRQLHSRNRSLNSRSVNPYASNNSNAGLGLGLGLGSLDRSREKDAGEYLDRSSFMKPKQQQQQQQPSLSSFAERSSYGKAPSSHLPHGYEDRARLGLADSTTLSASPTELDYLNQIGPLTRLGAPPPGLDSQRRLTRSPYDMDMQPQGPSTATSNYSYYPSTARRAGLGLPPSTSRGQGSAPLPPPRRVPRLPPAPSAAEMNDDEDDDRLFFHCNDFDDDGGIGGGGGSGSSGPTSRSLPPAPLSSSSTVQSASSRIFSSSSPPHRISADRDSSSDWDWALSSRFAGPAHSTIPSNLRSSGPQQAHSQQPHHPYHSQNLPPSSREQFSAAQRGFGPAPGNKKP